MMLQFRMKSKVEIANYYLSQICFLLCFALLFFLRNLGLLGSNESIRFARVLRVELD